MKPRLGWVALVLLAPMSAQALPAGGVFAGPARPGGSSTYYNPGALAAMEPGWGVLLETGLIVGAVSYQRAGVSPYDGQPFQPTSFDLLSPTMDFTLTAPTPWPWLSWALGGFPAGAASTDYPDEGSQALFGSSALILSYAVATGPVFRIGKKIGLSVMGGVTYNTLSLRYGQDYGAFGNEAIGADVFPYENPDSMGWVNAKAEGWAGVLSFGAWYHPFPWLKLGTGFVWLQTVSYTGSLVVEPPPAFADNFPGNGFKVQSNLAFDYPQPFILSAEAEFAWGPFTVAPFFQFQNKSVRKSLVFTLTEIEPDIISATQISVQNLQDDWVLGGRFGFRLNDAWEFGTRLDVDPRSVPTEVLTPINFDFTSIDIQLGARWTLNEHWALTGTYSFVVVPDVVVENSIYNVRAPSDSGLGKPSANGTYEIGAMKFLLSVQMLYGQAPAAPAAEPAFVESGRATVELQ